MNYGETQLEAINTIDQNIQIITFTFTEKAASEFKDGIDRFCLEELGNNPGLGGMFIYCWVIMRWLIL